MKEGIDLLFKYFSNKNILFNMKNIFNDLFYCIKIKKIYFFILCIATVFAIVVGVYAGFNFTDGVLSIDLSNIAYIKFLKAECGLFSLIWGLVFSLFIFFTLILLFNSKRFLIPFAIIFYMYLVYSQAVICISIVLIYGFLNSLIFLLVLIIYVAVIIFLFILAMMHMASYTNDCCYFKNCFSTKSYILWLFIAIAIICVLFSLLLTILKSFVILLVY